MQRQSASYDSIGVGYTRGRRADPRIAAQIAAALAEAGSVVNVGAGTGSYEPSGRRVVAVEPSAVMIAQRRPDAAPAVQARAEALPFANASFDAALAVLTIHHWADAQAGLREMLRVARRRAVILTWDPAFADGFWLVRDYFPEILPLDVARCPPLDVLLASLGRATVRPVLIPHDCTDGFLGAYWRRPRAYLDTRLRAGISAFALLDPALVEARIARLAADFRSGAWERTFGALLNLGSLDLGYRIVLAERD